MSYSSYDGQTISYDDSGNPTSYKGDTITWNGRLMTSYTKGNRRYEYSYNSNGMRTVKKIYENNELIYTYLYIWDGDFLLASRISTADSEEPTYVRYLYDESGELYGMDYNGAGFFGFIKNLQGDIVSIVPLDSQSDGEVNIEYDAWGKPIFEQASSGSEALIMAMIIAATNVAYRSYFYDFDTGLYYLRSRYYDPEIGRFINADDTAYLGYDSSPLSMNIFAYCENNPVCRIDINGRVSVGIVVAGNIVMVGGVAGVVAFKKSLAVKMYLLSIANAKTKKDFIEFKQNNEYRDFYTTMVKRFKESTVVKRRIKDYNNKHWDYENEPISFYVHSLSNLYSDYDLHYSLGEVAHFHLYIKKISSKKYKIRIFTYESYNFEKWDKSKTDGFTKWVNNNFGLGLQNKGKLYPYFWSIDCTFEVKI